MLRQDESLQVEQLRSFGLKQGLSAIWLPEVMVIMDQIPKGMTGKPARIGLAATLQLPEMQDGDVPATWDVADVPANKKRVPAPLSVQDSLIEDYLAIERSRSPAKTPAPAKSALTPQGLDRDGWASTLLSYLVPALSSEVARILGLPHEDISLETPFCNLSFDSFSLTRFQERIRVVIGPKIPLVVRVCILNMHMHVCVCVCV